MADELVVEGLVVEASSRRIVDGVSYTLVAGQILALVGASGSGKTQCARAPLGLIRAQPGVVAGEIRARVGEQTFGPYGATRPPLPLRGAVAAYLHQDGRAALDPLVTVAGQLRRVLALPGASAQSPAEILRRAGFSSPETALPLFPCELSGGMAQRVGIALTLARNSRFLLADEPTTGLDPTVQQVVVEGLAALARSGVGVLFITHDLRLAARFADSLLILDEGRVVERLEPRSLGAAQSPAGRRLVESLIALDGRSL